MKISELKLNQKNPRLIKDEKFKKLVKSLKDFPQMMELRPIIVDDENIIHGGNMRYKALIELGFKEIPDNWVKHGKDLTPEQWREFIVKDNVSFGEWDYDLLENDWDKGKLVEWGLDLTDWDNQKLEAKEDDFDVPEGGIETDIVLGDLFRIGEHRLLCGDSTDSNQLEKLMNGEKADMVFTDPPYGVSIGKKNVMLNSFQKAGRNLTDIIDDDMKPDDLKVILVRAFTNLKQNIKDCCTIFVTAPQGVN